MKKQLMLILGTALGLNSMAQKQAPTLQPCNTFAAMEEGFLADPQLKATYEALQAKFEIEYEKAIAQQQSSSSHLRTTATQSVIPVVFHIMGPQTITDQTFINLISYINNDYGHSGSDVATINPAFASSYTDSFIRFALAQKDPNGNCTNGIIRHPTESIYWNQSSPAYNYSGTGTNRWPTNQYLNVYIVDCIAGSGNTCPPSGNTYIGGYTYLPGSTPYTTNGNRGDAIVVLKSQLAQANPLDSRTLSHEMGHWLNLYHTFGSSNNPVFSAASSPTAQLSSCSTDNVSDTPPTGGYFSICPSTFSLDCSTLPNVENIMDYSGCPKMFTSGQITRMQTALGASTGGRNNLWTAANLLATGITGGYTCTPVANFSANKQTLCAANTVSFTSTSMTGTGGSQSWIFEGGSPATSTASTQVVTYATPGTYSVSLTATNPTGTNTKTQTSYITVVQGGGGALLPDAHDFEAGLPGITVVNNNAGSVAWDINPSNGAISTAQSIFLNNAAQASSSGHVDYFETAIFNLANTTGVTLSYYYAYAKKVTAQADSFRVQYSLDCGGTWTTLLGVPTIVTMASSSGGVQAASFSPTAAQWKQVNLSTNILSAVNNKPSVKFRWWFKSDAATGSSNNIYIDQINLSGSVGINELESAMDMLVYPNPTNASSTIDFNMPADQKVKISVMDVLGREVEASDRFTMNGSRAGYVVNKNASLAKGVYIINIYSGNQKVSKKLIIE